MNTLLKIQNVRTTDFSVKVVSAEKNMTNTMHNHFGLAVFDVKAVVDYMGTPVDIVETKCSFGRYDDFFPEEMWEDEDFNPDEKMVADAIDCELDCALTDGYTYEDLFGEELLHRYSGKTVYYTYGEKYYGRLCHDGIEKSFEDLYCILVPEDEHFTLLFGKERYELASKTIELPIFTKYYDMNTEREVYEYDGTFYNHRLEPIRVKPYGRGAFDLLTTTQYPKGRVVVSYNKRV
jgi:hypothetical protein